MRRDVWQHEAEVVARCRFDGSEDVCIFEAVVVTPRRPLAAQPPAMAYATLLSYSVERHLRSTILKVERDSLVRMRLRRRFQCARQPLFTQVAWAWGSEFGCTCRAFCRENPIRRSTLLKLAGW